jgi:RimJ/RimL family protein N-acetyltransferase
VTGVVLTPLREEDSDRLFAWINDRALVLLNAPFRPVARAAHDVWFETVQRDPSRVIRAIRDAPDGPVLGTCQLHDLHPIHRTAELQIRIGAATARGRGVGTASVRRLLALAFGELDLHRVFVHVFTTNVPAIRLYQKIGFRHEGTLREAALIDDRRVDVQVMGILRAEWHD